MASKADRTRLIERIKAFFARAADAASTESEIEIALRQARKMMAEHEVTDDDLNFGGEQVTRETVVKTDHDQVRNKLATSVGRFCHCVAYTDRNLFDAIVYIGLTSETIFAHWLLDQLAAFVERRLAAHPREIGVRRLTRTERESFLAGCVGRIADRLSELTPAPAPSNGRDLVLARQALIRSFMDTAGIKLREPFKLYKVDQKSYAAGQRAGNDAEFNRPIDQETQVKGLLHDLSQHQPD
jgi:hypothetical protein